jgi:hypothetical protein
MARGGAPTSHIRIAEDLAEMLGWVVRVGGTSAAEFADPLLRPAVEAAFEPIRPIVKKFKAAQAAKELTSLHAAELGEAGA